MYTGNLTDYRFYDNALYFFNKSNERGVKAMRQKKGSHNGEHKTIKNLWPNFRFLWRFCATSFLSFSDSNSYSFYFRGLPC